MGKLKNIGLGNWILIGMVLGLIVGLFLNFFVKDPFIKNTILMNNVFHLGGTVFIRLMKSCSAGFLFNCCGRCIHFRC